MFRATSMRPLILLLLCALVSIAQPNMVRAADVWGPVLGNVTPTSVQICWRNQDRPARGLLFGDYQYVGAPAYTNYRVVTLEGLQPDTVYRYTFLRADGQQDDHYFTTAPEQGEAEFAFAVFGDTRSNPAIHQQVVDAIRGFSPRFVLHTGDLVGDGSKVREWESFFRVEMPLTASTPYFAAPGNHEGNSPYFFRTLLGAPGGGENDREWYGLIFGNVRMVVLNSTRRVAAQRDWLERYLTQTDGKAAWTVVTFHYPPYSSGARNGDATMRQQWVPVLERHKVDVVFLGHDHFYERSEKAGVQYVICGGGGAPQYAINAKRNPYQQYAEQRYHYLRVDVAPDNLRVREYRLDGTVGDEFMLQK